MPGSLVKVDVDWCCGRALSICEKGGEKGSLATGRNAKTGAAVGFVYQI